MKIPNVIVSLDAEWVNAGTAGGSAPSSENRLISYQLTVLNRATGASASAIIEPRDFTRRARRGLPHVLALALRKALKEGVVPDYPDALALVAHFSRADLTHLRHWKDVCRRMDGVRGTFATTTKPLNLVIPTPGGERPIRIIVIDTMLLAPGRMRSLERIGAALGIPKIALPTGHTKERMDLFKRAEPDLFGRYAITDTIIAARWVERVWGIFSTSFGITDHVPTLAAAAVRIIRDLLLDAGISPDGYFGYETIQRKRQPLACLTEVWVFSANAYHGGRNEAFQLGHSPRHCPLYDVDAVSAYTTAMAMIRVPEWHSVRPSKDLGELAVVDDALTYARAKFEFPRNTRFPCLPVRAGDRGLVYPLIGTSWCTGAELKVALAMGAVITVESGWRIEWVTDSPRCFELFTHKINAIRTTARAKGDKILDELAKEVGNSGYGKTAQAVNTFRTVTDAGVYGRRGKRVFDPRTEQMRDLPPSRITCPMLAAFTTGVVRALASEAVARLPTNAFVVSVTTDGFLSSVPIQSLDTSGPVARAFGAARKRISSGNPAIWEEKHRVARVLVMKTRGVIATRPYDRLRAGKPVLARGGFRLEQGFRDEWAECQAWSKLFRERTNKTRLARTTLKDLRDQWLNNEDLVEESSSVRLNLDFDMKRRLTAPADVGGVITSATAPWETVDAFHVARDSLERWKSAQRRVLKTVRDYLDLQAWQAGRPGQAASGSTAQSGRPPLVNLVLRAAARGALGMAGWPNTRWASLITACGWRVTEQTVKDARRRGQLTLNRLTALSPEEIDFLEVLLMVRPDADIEALMEPGSVAAAGVADVREFIGACDYHDPDLPEADDWGEPSGGAGGASLCAI